MKTAKDIYRTSLAILGQEEEENTQAFEKRAVPLINFLLAELMELDLALKGEEFPTQASACQITSLSDPVGYEDALVLSLLPLGLASLLIQEEEPERGSFFHQLYLRERESIRSRCRKGRRHKIGRLF